jgi:lysozyme family protein
MITVESIITDILKREGGYVDHPKDLGGPTNFGITQRTARVYGFKRDVRDIDEGLARRIYRAMYYMAPGFDDVAVFSKPIAAELMDTGVNMGVTVAVTFLQRALNVLNRSQRDYPDLDPDGIIGPQTLGALNEFLELRGSAGERVLLRALNSLQGARYIEIAEHRQDNEAFVYGWYQHRVVVA